MEKLPSGQEPDEEKPSHETEKPDQFGPSPEERLHERLEGTPEKQPTREEMNTALQAFLEKYGERWNELPEEAQGAWYEIEMEVEIAKDRATALQHLKGFEEQLERFFKEREGPS